MGAIHGRLLTAWSLAGVVGPLLVVYISQAAVAQGVPKAELYDTTLYVLPVLLVVGLVCNLLIRPVPSRYFMPPEQVAALQASQGAVATGGSFGIGLGGFSPGVALAWSFVVVPIAWGVWMTLAQVKNMF